jgi:pimeloyl-ACP methyl ester carboxylesterase
VPDAAGDDVSADDVSELELLAEHGRELGVRAERAGSVRRVEVRLGEVGVSALRWGAGTPELVVLHGGGQNAHTWDGLLLRSRRSAVAIDLPGHGRSSWLADGAGLVGESAPLVAGAIERLAPEAQVVVGASSGGLVGLCLAAWHPELVPRLVVVDVSPGSGPERARDMIEVSSVPDFPSLDALLARVREFRPGIPERALRRSIHYNARQLVGGRWTWRHDRRDPPGESRFARIAADLPRYWEVARSVRCPTTLVLGGRSRLVRPADVARFREVIPQLDVVTVPGAGHSVHGDRPDDLLAVVEQVVSR